MDDTPLILIIDDNDEIRDFVTTVIENMGYRSESLPGGQEALEYLTNNPQPDLILLDIIMPGMTGIDLLRTIKGMPPLDEIIVVMVTGVQHITDKELAFKLGANDYIVKPFDPRELVARIRTHINLKKATEQCVIQKKLQEQILSTVPGIVFLKDRSGIYVHGNEQFADITGVPSEEIEGKTDTDLFSFEEAEERRKTDELILCMGVPGLEMQEELHTKKGETRTFLTRKSAVYNERDELSGIVGVSIDITEQVILRDAYCEKEELLTAIINSGPAEIWVINREREIILQNSMHLMKFGTLIGQKIESLPIDEQTKKIWSEGLICSLQGESKVWEYGSVVENKPVLNIVCIGPIRSSDQVMGAIGIISTIPGWDKKTPENETIIQFIRTTLNNNGRIAL